MYLIKFIYYIYLINIKGINLEHSKLLYFIGICKNIYK